MDNEKPSVRQIIHGYTDGRLSARPEYYSGRGVNRGDLNGNHIKMVYDGIVKELGKEAGDALIEMVRVLTDMSATGFLTSLYRLEQAGWKFDAKMFNQAGDGICATDEITAFCSVMSVMSRGNPDSDFTEFQSRQISNEFMVLIGQPPIQRKGGFASTFVQSYDGDGYCAHPDFSNPYRRTLNRHR